MSIILALAIVAVAFYVMSEIIDKHFIKSLDNIAAWLKMPESVSGATLLAFGTSAPEISTALFALFLANANPGLGVGTIVGSAIFQILIVIGFAAVVKTSYLNWKPILRDSIFYALSIILLIVFIADGKFTRLEAIGFVATYALYLFLLFLWAKFVEKRSATDSFDIIEEVEAKPPTNPIIIAWHKLTYPLSFIIALIPDADKNHKWTVPVFILSLGVIGFASFWLVIAAESIAVTIGVPSTIIALTLLAGGSSIPEMISSAIVARQGRGDMAIANAIGSNIFDILMSLGLPVLIFTFMRGEVTGVGEANISSSLLLLFFTLIAVLFLLAAQKFKVSRRFGYFLIFLYLLYVIAAYAGWIG